jgi:Holliday junction resolvase
MRRAAKVDANQEDIVQALRAAGATVQSLAAIGKGCPDLLVGWQGDLFLIEVKAGKGKPNDKQQEWHEAWATTVYVVRTPQEALCAIGAMG